MGTNYYLESTARLPVAFGQPRLHIGKSSGGWCFALHVYPKMLCEWGDEWVVEPDHHRPSNLGQWLGLLEHTTADGSARIIDEYGTVLSMQEMRSTIMNRSWEREMVFPNMHYASEAEFHRLNMSEPGPNGLVRHQLDGRHCIAHGDGTWDLVVGDFT